MSKLRIGMIGAGRVGAKHAQRLKNSDVVEVCAVCDILPERAQALAAVHGINSYAEHRELIDRESPDFILVQTPHPAHLQPALDAFERGIHVLCEKPLASDPAEADRMLQAAARHNCKLGVMFQQRTDPKRRRLREIVRSGEIGELRRIYMASTWYRTQAYYATGTWRGTWAGEGGGVLLNQAPHDLDFLIWLAGKPVEVLGHTATVLHDIETEDAAGALITFENGAHCYFHTSTNELPETYRVELCGDRGKAIFDGETITLWKLNGSITQWTHIEQDPKGQLPAQQQSINVPEEPWGHAMLVEDFARAVVEDREPLAPAKEALTSVDLAAAILYSAETKRAAQVPVDRDAYSAFLREKRRTSKFTS